jgi:hypothetical protein
LPCKNNNDEIFKSRYRDVRNKLKNVISINELFRPKIKKGVEDYTQNTSWYGMVWYGMVWYGTVWYGMVWYGKTLFKHASLDQRKLFFMRGVTQ